MPEVSSGGHQALGRDTLEDTSSATNLQASEPMDEAPRGLLLQVGEHPKQKPWNGSSLGDGPAVWVGLGTHPRGT